MSSVINNKNIESSQVALSGAKGEARLSKEELFTASLVLPSSQLMKSLGLSEDPSKSPYASSGLDLMGEMELENEAAELSKNQRNLNSAVQSMGAKSADTSSGQTGQPSGNQAIAEAAGLITKLQQSGQESLEEQLENQLKSMQAQLQALQSIEQFVTKFVAAMNTFKNDPTQANFQALITLLKGHFANNPKVLAELTLLATEETEAIAKQQEWNNKSGFKQGWDNFWGVDQDERYAWSNFVTTAGSMFNIIKGQAFGNEPEVFADFMANGQEAFTKRITQILSQMTTMLMMLAIMGGNGKNAIIEAQALVLDVMQEAMKNNADQNEQQTKMADINVKIQSHNYDKAQDALKKLEKAQHHHSGIFGWVEDLVDSIVDTIKKIVSQIRQACTSGNIEDFFKDMGKDLYSDLGIKNLVDAVKEIASGHVLKGFESLVTQVLLVYVLGPVGILLADTPIAKDFQNAVKLVVDAVAALGEVVFAGLAECIGDSSGAKDLLADAKAHGIAILENPALQAVADIAMIAIIVASCISGQFWLAGIMAVLLVMNDVTDSHGNSLMTDMTNGIAKALHAPKWVADLIVMVAVTILTFGAGGAEAAADEGVEEGVEEGANLAAKEGADTASEVAEESATEASNSVGEEVAETATDGSKNALSKLVDLLKEGFSKVGDAIGSRAGTAMVAGSMAAGSTNFATDFAQSVAKKDKKLQEILEVLLEVLEVLAGVAGGAGMASSDVLSEINQKVSSGLKDLMPNIAKYIDENQSSLMNMAKQFQVGGMIGQGVANMGMSGDQIIQGKLLQTIEDLQGVTATMNTAQDIVDEAMETTQKNLKELTQEEKQFIQEMNAPYIESQAIANALV